MSEANCGNCIFWLKAEPPQETKTPDGSVHYSGFCRIRPPEIFMVTSLGGPQFTSAFPGMTDKGWCGEHQSKPEGRLS